MARGTGKHKGKLPFMCLNCARIGHLIQNDLILKVKTKKGKLVERKERKRSSKEGTFLVTKKRYSTQKRTIL